MIFCGVRPLLRRATDCIIPGLMIAALSFSASVKAQAQVADGSVASAPVLLAANEGQPSENISAEWSSSATPVTGSSAEPLANPAPSPAAGAAGGQYGSGSHGYWSSDHIAFEAGAGANAPIGNDQPVITWGGNFTVGAGLKINPHISGLIEYQFLDDKLPGALIAQANAQGGHAHIWSLTMEPVIYFFPKHKTDAYVTGGGGFYRKVTSFTDPEEVEQCYYFCVIGTTNVVVSHFSSNQGGLNAGFGITHRFGGMYGDSNMKLFAEARYLWIDTPGVGQTNGLGSTGLIPVTIGLRF